MTPTAPTPALTPPNPIDNEADQPQQQEEFGPRNRNLPKQLQNAITEAIKRAQAEEKWMRRQEVLQDSKHRLYDMGVQHFYLRGNSWQQALPGTSYAAQGGGEESFGEYIDDYNIFTQFAMIPRVKLTESEPSIDFQPCDPNDEDDIEAANAAEAMKVDFDRNNDVKELRQNQVYHLQMSGRFVTWTRTENQKYSSSRRGMSRRIGKSTVYGCLESKIPLMANDQSKFWYTILYEDLYVRNAKTDYPWVRGITEGPCLGEGEYERTARLSILRGASGSQSQIQTGDATATMVTEANAWLRLSAFEEEKKPYASDDGQTEETQDEDGETRQKTVRDKLAELFPDGVHSHVIGQQYCESWNESMDDRTGVQNAYLGKGQSRMAIMKPFVVIQDRFNNNRNKIAETQDYGDGSTWFAGALSEFQSIVKQKSQPGAMRHLKEVPQGMKASDLITQEKTLEVSASMVQDMEFMFGPFSQFIMSAPPSSWGQQMPDQQTASGYQLAAAQAVGILGGFWVKIAKAMSDVYMHNCLAVMADSEYPDEIVVMVQGKTTTIRKESLTKGNFRAFPDTESGFPESTSGQKQTEERVATLLAQTPLAGQLYGSPDVVSTILRDWGVKWTLPESESRDKQQREIETLLSESPTLTPELAEMMAEGAGVADMLDAIQQAIVAGQQQAQQQAEVAQAASIMAATAAAGASGSMQGGAGVPPPPMAAPAPALQPTPFDPSTIAASSVKIWPSDYQGFEANKCQDWLSSDECNIEITIGRPVPGMAEPQPNIAGVLNVMLHWMEHEAAKLKQAPPPSAPLPLPHGATGAPPAAPPPAAGAPPAPGAPTLPAGM